MTDALADLPPERGRLLFVDLIVHRASVRAGHHLADRSGQAFVGRLIAAGVLPPSTSPAAADDALLAAGHGVTALVAVPAGRAQPSAADLTAGVGSLWQRIALWRPAAIVFIDRRAAAAAAGRPIAERWGVLEGVALAGRPCFLAPGPDLIGEERAAGLTFLRNLAAAVADGPAVT